MCEWGKLYWNFAVRSLMSSTVSPNQTEADKGWQKKTHSRGTHTYTPRVFSQIQLSFSYTHEKGKLILSERPKDHEGKWAETCVRIIAVI